MIMVQFGPWGSHIAVKKMNKFSPLLFFNIDFNRGFLFMK